METTPRPSGSAQVPAATILAALVGACIGAALVSSPALTSLYTAQSAAQARPVTMAARSASTPLARSMAVPSPLHAGPSALSATPNTAAGAPLIYQATTPSSAQGPGALLVATMAIVSGLVGYLWKRASAQTQAMPNMAMMASTGLKTDDNGMEYVDLAHPNGATAKIYLYGADVVSYKDDKGCEWIAVRPDAKMDGSKPISGGLSHCFPQFGPGEIQQHGFARNVDWTLVECTGQTATFELLPSDYTRAMWDKPFRCLYQVALTDNSCDTELLVQNTGEEDSFTFQAALHSYFDITSCYKINIGGSFKERTYIDKMENPPVEKVEKNNELTINQEYDRVYLGVTNPVLLDGGKGRQLNIFNNRGWKDTVIWNPYGNEDMGYDKFVCIESVAYEPVTLGPGNVWSGSMSMVPGQLNLRHQSRYR